MNTEPETIAAILAEMRNPPHKWEGFSRADLPRSYADRIVCAWANELCTDAWLLNTEIGGEGGDHA